MMKRIWRCVALGLIGLGATSCATESVLVHGDDALFQHAQARLQHTQQVVKALHPSAAEQHLFMQAASFNQYRFSPPKKSTAKYLAEAASAVTDFPGFQSLAGSLDMEDLRFRAPDSAVQLWETLLQQYPNSSLKPLTLYRLGWAYRNVGAQGLPHDSPREPLNALVRSYPHTQWATWANQAKEVPYKTKDEAGFYSLIPGMGQVYLGDRESGMTRLGVALAGLVAVAVPAYAAAQGKHVSMLSTAVGLGGLIVLSFDFTNSYEDAMHGVVLWNERAEAAFQKQHPDAP